MFRPDRGVLRMHRPPESSDVLFLCWPVFVYRVTAPVLKVHNLNIFEKVVLALCRAGVRHADEIAAHIHQNRDLCVYILRELVRTGQLDQSRAVTPEGLRTLESGVLGEEPELMVTHVFQDPFSGDLWTRTATALEFEPVRAVGDAEVTLRLGTAGRGRRVHAQLVSCDVTALEPPSAHQVITAIGEHRALELRRRAEQFAAEGQPLAGYDAEQELRAVNSTLLLPEAAVRRVADIRMVGAEYLLVWLQMDHDPQFGGVWRARDPFGLDPSLMLQRSLTARLEVDEDLRTVLAGIAEASVDRLHEQYRTIADTVRERAESRLVGLLGAGIRSHPDFLDLLIGFEDAVARGASRAELEAVVRETFRLYEHLFRRMVREYPPPETWHGIRLSNNNTRRALLRDYATRTGFDLLPAWFPGVSGEESKYRAARAKAVGEDHTYLKDLVGLLLVAAADSNSAHRDDHPLRTLASRCPTALNDLVTLNGLRNRGSHSDRDASVEDDVEWCRGLAIAAAQAVLTMSPQNLERTVA